MAEKNDLEKYQEFVLLVRQMRQAQKLYFQTRHNQAMQKAKYLEKEVDSWELQSSKQEKLF